ncbi:MAG: hypothetical protein OXQ94_16650 [Gemmatimonadota bacterium]|nr:hypothetical protein [Gemmatimonadota bacterium]MDE2873309.1 hypothetical protein [Gemmatimonadota bacterium]
MATTQRRRGLLAPVLCLLLAAACGGNAESTADGEATGDSATGGDAPPAPGDAEVVLPGGGGDDRGAEGDPEDVAPGESADPGGTGTNDPAGAVTPEPGPFMRIPAGTRVAVVADEDISTADYRVNDPVITTVIRDVRGPGGERLLPRGVRLLGRVEASVGSGGPGEIPVLEIAFETLSAYTWERPVEGVVVNTPVVLDPAAARARRSASGRVAAVTEVPGLIMAGTIIAVELREAVHVPPPAAPAEPVPAEDSVAPKPDSIPGAPPS